jgi:hypothetical protein
MPEEGNAVEVAKRLAEALKTIKTELQEWHEESKASQSAISELQSRLEKLSTKTSAPAVEKELEELRQRIATLPVKGLPEGSAQTINLMFQEQLKELEELNKENIENSKEIKDVRRQLEALSKRTTTTPMMDSDVEKLRGQMVDIAESTEKFNNLKQILLKHNEEFEDLYSSIGKEKVELDSLNQTLSNLKGELVEWSTRNKENSVEIGSLKSDITSIGRQLKEKDVSSKISDISRNLEMLADRMERIQKAERDILSQQDKMLRFDKGLKELVRKAVVASMSRREFESELDHLESAGGAAPAEAAEDFEEAPAKPVRKPTEAEVQSKLAALRMNLQKPRAEDVAEEDLMKGFAAFEQELQSTDDPKTLWVTTRDQLLKIARSDLQDAKAIIKSLKDAGKDVSKAQLSATKFEIGLVSLETAFSLQSLEKAKEIAVKLSDLHRQLDTALEQLS